MQRTTGDGESEQQAAGRIFVVGIILNDVGLWPGLSDFVFANIAFNGTLKGMAAKFEFTSSELSANVIQRFHGMGYRDYSGSLRSVQHEGGRAERCERGWSLMIFCARATRIGSSVWFLWFFWFGF